MGIVNHRFASVAPDIGGPNTIKISHWNDSLVFNEGTAGQVLKRDPGSPDGAKWDNFNVFAYGETLKFLDVNGIPQDVLWMDALGNVILNSPLRDVVISAIGTVNIDKPLNVNGNIVATGGIQFSGWDLHVQPNGVLVFDAQTGGPPAIYMSADGDILAEANLGFGFDKWFLAWRQTPGQEYAGLFKFDSASQTLHIATVYDGSGIPGANVAVNEITVGPDTTFIHDVTVTGEIHNVDIIKRTMLDAKGDLLVGLGDNDIGRLQVGLDGWSLVADSTAPEGVKWAEFVGTQGPPGADGIPGQPGVGMPGGGTAGQLLTKISDVPYESEWRDAALTPGPEGPMGPQGPIGPQGIQGIQGIQGEVGPQGTQGVQGEAGPTGPGVATGGTTGQLLTKTGPGDFETGWFDLGAITADNEVRISATNPLAGELWVDTSAPDPTAGVDILPNNTYIRGYETDGTTVRNLIGVATSNEIYIGSGNVTMLRSANTIAETGGVTLLRVGGNSPGAKRLEVQTDSSNLPILGFHRSNQKVWTMGIISDNRFCIGADDFSSLTNPWRLIIEGNGRLMPAEGVAANGSMWIPTGSAYHGGGINLIYFTGENTIDIGGWAGRLIRTTYNTEVHGTLYVRDALYKNYDSPIAAPNGWWVCQPGSNGNMYYAYNCDASFNDAGGSTRLRRTVWINDGAWVNNSSGYNVMMSSGNASYIAHNTNLYVNQGGGGSVFQGGVTIHGRLDVNGQTWTNNYLYTPGVWDTNDGWWMTSPDFVFEHHYTGRIEKFAGAPGAKNYTGLQSLADLEDYTRENWHLPHHGRENELFRKSDEVLAEVERLYLHLFSLDKRLRALEG